jgi:DHA1 family multidrug resistance protein-like MFS transporter
MIIYTLFHLGQALAHNIETLLVTRFLSAFFAVAPLTCIGGGIALYLVFFSFSWHDIGLIADIWPPVGRGPATSLFTASVFLGPVLGPIVEGFILQSGASWRWIFWIMMIFAGVCTLIIIFALPETYAPVILLKKAKKLRKLDAELNKDLYAEHEKGDWSAKGLLERTLFRTFKMLALEPILRPNDHLCLHRLRPTLFP